MKKQIEIKGMSCQHCVMAVKEALAGVDGITPDYVQIGSAVVTLAGDETHLMDAAREAIAEEGFEVTAATAA